jgi:membrane associated rhomboid family serine protease
MAPWFAYQFSVLLPAEGIDWQGHVFGFVGGVLGGWFFRDRRPTRVAPPPLGPTTPLPSP